MGMRRSARNTPGLVAPPQQDADLLAALLLGDVNRLGDVLAERRGELLWWSQPCPLPLYHAAVLGGSAEAVTVLAAAGAPLKLAEVHGFCLSSEILGLLNKQLGDYRTSILDRAARGRRSAAVLAAASGRCDLLAAMLQAGGLPHIGGCCRTLAQAAADAACQADKETAAAAVTATATLGILLDSGACQDDCIDAASCLHQWLRGRRRSGKHRRLCISSESSLEAAAGVWRWLVQQSQRQGRFEQLGATQLRSVLSMAAAQGDIDSLRRFAGQLSGAWHGCDTAHGRRIDVFDIAAEVLHAGMFAPDPCVLQRLLLELACASGSGSLTGGTSSWELLSGMMSGRPGWELLQIAAPSALEEVALAAAKHGRQAALQAILQAGQPITLQLINTAAGLPDLRLLRWLLAAGPLPAPEVHGTHLRLERFTICRQNGYPCEWYQGCPIWHAIRQVSTACSTAH